MEHLDCLYLRLSNERIRLNNAKTEQEKALRTVWVQQIEKEIQKELDFLGKTDNNDPIDLNELFNSLND